MSDIFSGLFGGGGDSSGGGGGGDIFGGLFGGGQGGSPFSDLTSGDPSSIVNSLGGMGLGAFDPSQGFNQTPAQAAAQGGDPSGQLQSSQGDGQGQQGQGQGQQGGGKQQSPLENFAKILKDALSGQFQKPGYSNIGGGAPPGGGGGASPSLPKLAQQANQLPLPQQDPSQAQGGQDGQQPGATDPSSPTSSTASGGPGAPGAPAMDPNAPIPPQRPAGLGPNQSTAALRKGDEAGALAPGQAVAAGADGAAPVSLKGGTPPGGISATDPRFGQNQPGAQQPGGGQQGQQGQIPPIIQAIMSMLLPQLLSRMGPMGQMLAGPLSQLLAGQGGLGQLAGQAAGGRNFNPEFPMALRGRQMWNQAMPGGAAGRTGNRFTDTLVGAESNGKNIVSGTDRDSRGLTLAQGGNPREISQGYFQIQNHGPNGTWARGLQRVGLSLSQYPSPRDAPFDIQHKVAQSIPINQWGPRTIQILRSKIGPFDMRATLGQLERGMTGYSY